MNDITTTDNGAMFHRAMTAPANGGNVGAIEIESQRAIAEAQGQLVLAKRFPRSMAAATATFLDSCKSPEFAATAFYAVPNRGSGPSIRFAEEAARCYSNFEYGHRELSRTPGHGNTPGKSEVEVYAWDKELNNRSIRQITVEHVLDSRNGRKLLTDQADIDNKIANVASKQMRGRILALMPKGMIAAGIAEAQKTLAGGNERPLSERITRLVTAFTKYGVTAERLAKHLGHAVDQMTADEYTDLVGIGAGLKDGGKGADFFPTEELVEPDTGAAAAIAAASKKTQSSGANSAARQPSKNAETQGKAVKDQAASVKEKATQAEPAQAADSVQQAPAESSPAPAPETPAANAGAPADDDVF